MQFLAKSHKISNTRKNNDTFTFDEKFLEMHNFSNSQVLTSPTQETEFIKETEQTEQPDIFDERRLTKLLEEDFIKDMRNTKSVNKISSFDNNIDRKLAEIYPAFQKYSPKNINFLRKYLYNLKLTHKNSDSELVQNVKDKLLNIQPKSNKEYIQIMKKLFNFYKVKKTNEVDISKENIKMKFSLRNFRESDLVQENMDDIFNFKLTKEAQIIYDLSHKKQENIVDIETINVDSPVKKKQIDWFHRKKNKKSYYCMQIEKDNSIKLSRNLFCE